MTYVYEQMSEEDKERINLKKLTSNWPPRPNLWAVDRATGNFIINTFWGDEEDRVGRSYLFSWNGHILRASTEFISKPNEPQISLLQFRERIALPPLLECERNSILKELKSALMAILCRGRAISTVQIEINMLEVI